MGLDQAVLKGFESNASDDDRLSKDEVENLLRRGAYDIFSEDKDGAAEKESNSFVQQDIDSILERRSTTVVHENTGSKSNAAGGTFSKARFVSKTPDALKGRREDVDIEDPDFWRKMIGDPSDFDDGSDLLKSQPRQRTKANYSESDYKRRLDATLMVEPTGSESESDDDDDHAGESCVQRTRWGGSLPGQWKKDDAIAVYRNLTCYGYGLREWSAFMRKEQLTNEYDATEVRHEACMRLLVLSHDVHFRSNECRGLLFWQL